MNTPPKKKLCWNCEGRVTYQDENCPYCGVYLSPISSSEKEAKESLFSPPYRVNHDEEEDQQVPISPYKVEEERGPVSQEAVKPILEEEKPPVLTDEMRTLVLPLVLLLSGSVFFLFGIALLLFSHNGVFTLQWNSSNWYLFFILGLPMLFYGWRSLQQEK